MSTTLMETDENERHIYQNQMAIDAVERYPLDRIVEAFKISYSRIAVMKLEPTKG